ncbi:hypothetical protein SPF06_12945 [Sinomonas sp. JGH33]|uniref:DUF4398 domain-containing protein n=1 Tax=Sinomonas terricola TaxID=3110330 RepID=A0ABU5T7R1_9MICC|nr:hypothetical protein [Sinomonas sp. JGH33]MEA5455633.1 hypothetical protein [Sinomonas sp. JGH33]
MNAKALRLAPAAAALGLAAAVLAGCGQAPSDLDSQFAANLQASTERVRGEAAAGHYAEALEELTAIESQANSAAAQGTLSPARKQDILAAVALVRADLETHVPPSPTVSPASPTPASATHSPGQPPTP